jgi:hypothetical protein
MLGLETLKETIPITWPVVAKSGLSNNTAAGMSRNGVRAERLEDRQRHVIRRRAATGRARAGIPG